MENVISWVLGRRIGELKCGKASRRGKKKVQRGTKRMNRARWGGRRMDIEVQKPKGGEPGQMHGEIVKRAEDVILNVCQRSKRAENFPGLVGGD